MQRTVTRLDAFKAELIDLCIRHRVRICADGWDGVLGVESIDDVPEGDRRRCLELMYSTFFDYGDTALDVEVGK